MMPDIMPDMIPATIPNNTYKIPALGYYLYPKSYPASLGYSGLLVTMRSRPTNLHFDPEALHVNLAFDDGQVRQTTLRLKSVHICPKPLCPGRIALYDRKEKKAQFFIFGGRLESTVIGDETLYLVNSNAPIIELTGDPERAPNQFVFELEALLAVYIAQWAGERDKFYQRLVSLEPKLFYMSSIATILSQANEAHAHTPHTKILLERLELIQNWLIEEMQWPTTVPELVALLDPEPAKKSENNGRINE